MFTTSEFIIMLILFIECINRSKMYYVHIFHDNISFHEFQQWQMGPFLCRIVNTAGHVGLKATCYVETCKPTHFNAQLNSNVSWISCIV